MSTGSIPVVWPGRTAVVGDVGGHLGALVGELARLGADPVTGRLPDDLRVVQVGDLVHRGPDSAGVVALVDRYLTEQPDQWVQLVGNHEGLYVHRRTFDWPQRLDSRTVKTLRRWWATGLMRVAAVVSDPTGRRDDHLVTHAGVTSGFWRDMLHRPATARDTARALDDLIGHGESDLFRPGHLVGGGAPSPRVGPVWANATTEFLPSWVGVALPFSQIHGHASTFDWANGRLRTSGDIAERTRVDVERRHVTTVFDGGEIVGVDPGHDERPVHPWRAWQFTDS